MLISPEKYLPKIYFTLFLIVIFFSVNLSAQTKKKSLAAKKTQAASKSQSKKTADKKEDKSKSKSKVADSKSKTVDKKQRAAEIARQRAEQQARRQAILEEQRRRAQLAREAQARRLAFERGLREETIANISNDNIEGEDLEVRAAAVNALGSHAGTIVVMEPQTGKVLSIVNQDWAIRKGFKPCSTVKLVTAVAGLNENVINEFGGINSRNFPMNLDDALAYSNNSYFQTVGSQLGSEKLVAYARMLGLGQPTGINAADETGGRLPYNNNNARIYSHGDDFEVTPLQLGVIVSAISNGGKILVPQIPRTRTEKANFRGAMHYQLNLPKNNLQRVIPGMLGAAQYGTARRGIDPTFAVAGKTGSCIGQGSWVGLFASVAPIENPKYAVIVITRGQGERGKYAAAIAGKIYQSLGSRLIIDRNNTNVAKIPLELRPQTKINAKTSAKLDADEGEDSEDNDAAQTKPKQTITVQSAPKNFKKEDKSSEIFPPVIVKVKKSDELTRPRLVPINPRVTPDK